MDEREFERLAEATLGEIEAALESSGLDLDFELQAGGVLEVEFTDGAKMIINRHAAAREIWVADRSGGFHFRSEGKRWVDTRDGRELFEKLSSLVGNHLGVLTDLKPG